MGLNMRSKNFFIPLACLLFALCLEVPLFSSTAMNVEVVKGDVSLVEQKKMVKIHASNESIIQYEQFEVQEGAEVKIIQPSQDSILVINVKSNQPTRIKSKLSANGVVYIFNPQGIFIDKEALVEKGTFYFIGSEFKGQNLANLHLDIPPTTGDVVNHGKISSFGEIHLMGRHVVNSGTIQASEKVFIARTNAKDQLSILHTGSIQSKDVFIEARDGTCEIYGKINAKNAVDDQYGGKICILGQQVRLIGAYLDASGTFKGGQVNLGGDFEGRGDLFKATRTSVDDATIIDASAIEYGEGGQVILWSQELTSFQGEIYARGGRKYGSGGLVETSSLNHLGIYSGRVNVDAACGEAGQWLLDPSNIVISDSEDATDDLAAVTEYPPKSGSQVTINVKVLNNFSGGKLHLSASNRITIDADISNISSTLDLTLSAGNQIRFKNKQINVPNGKISFIIENQESGQIICSKDFKGITAHQMVMIAPTGKGNGFQVETPSLVLNLTNSNRSQPEFIFKTDVFALHNNQHQLYLKRARAQIGTVHFEGALEGFDFVNAETNLIVEGKAQIAHLATKGATKVELLGGGEVSEIAEFENLRGIALGGKNNSHLKINGNLNTTSSLTKLSGIIETTGSFEAGDVKLTGHTVVNTNNNPFTVHQNITQENTVANLMLMTGSAVTTVEGSVYANDFTIRSQVAPAICGEVCVFNFTSKTPQISIAHDLIVSGQMDCLNLTTSGENKKVAFAKGGFFKGKTTFNHNGTTTLGDDKAASFHFEDMLDTHQSITYSHGLIYVQGPVEISDLYLIGDTSIQCESYQCNINGTLQQQEVQAHLNINTKDEPITISKFIEVEGISLDTTHPLNIEVPVHVSYFSTTSPSISFSDHLFVQQNFAANNVTTKGAESQLSILGGANIQGSALFDNGSNITLGGNTDSQFVITNRFSCSQSPAKMQGNFDVSGQVDLLEVDLTGHLNFKTHGHHFNVSQSLSQNANLCNLVVDSEEGEINFGKTLNVQNLELITSTPIYIGSEIESLNFSTNSPLVTFANNTLIGEKIEANSVITLGKDKKFQLNGGGFVRGDAKFANTGLLILGQSSQDILELMGPFDRSGGETIAQGTLRTHAAAIDFEKLSLSGPLNILSVSNDGTGGEINFHSEVDGAYPLHINAASSQVNINRAFGSETALSQLTVYANQMISKADLYIERDAGEFFTNIHLANNIQIECKGREGLFFYGTIDGNYDLNAIANDLVVIKKDIGSQNVLNALNVVAKRIDVWASISVNSGAMNFEGDLELCENVKFINSGRTGICFNGKVDGDHYVEIRVSDENGKISFNEDIGLHKPLRHVVLATHMPIHFNKRVYVDHFETTSPSATFYSDITVAGYFNAKNAKFDGTRQNVNLLGGGQILGNATFNNKGDLCLGDDDRVEFDFGGQLSRNEGPTYARGLLQLKGASADFSALNAVGNLKLISTNSKGTAINFNSTVDGTHQLMIDSKNGAVHFYDYVGNHYPLLSLEVNAPSISMQRQIVVKENDLLLNGNLYLMNHSSLKNLGGKKVFIAGTVNGEWDLSLSAHAQDAEIIVLGAIGDQKPVNHLSINLPNQVNFKQNVYAYNLDSTAPVLVFDRNVEVKQHLQANTVVMTTQDGQFSVLGGAYLKGSLELYNKEGSTILGETHFSTFTTENGCVILSENTYAQGLIQTLAAPMQFDRLHLSGPLKVSSVAQSTQGAQISFNKEISGGHAIEVSAGNHVVLFAKEVGHQLAMQSINVQASSIELGADLNILEGTTLFSGDVVLRNNIKIEDQGKGCISFAGQVNGPFSLEIINKHKDGQISFTKSVGQAGVLQNLVMTTQNQVEFPMSLDVVALTTTAPSLVFGDEATVHAEINAHHLLTKGKFRSVRLLGKGNFSGMTTFSNSGSLILGGHDKSEFVFSGPLAVENCVLISKGQIITRGGVSLKELSLKGHTSFNTNGHEFTVIGVVEQIVDNADLNIDVGAGQITFGSAVTANNLKFNTALPVQFDHAVNVAGFETKAPHVLFAHNVTVRGEIIANNVTTMGVESKVKLLGGGEIKGNTIFKNGRGIVLGGHDQAVITFHGPIDTTASLLEARGTIETINKTIDIGSLSVVGNTTIRSTSKGTDGKNIYFLGAVEGPKQLRANAGKAKVCFENHVGSQTALESLQATGSKIELDGDVSSLDGNVVFAGDVVFTNTCNLTAQGKASIIFQGTVNVDENAQGPVDLILDATGKIEFQKDVGDDKAFNEVIVTRVGELVCRSPLKSSIIQSKSKPFQKIEAKVDSKDSEEAAKPTEKQEVLQSELKEDVYQS